MKAARRLLILIANLAIMVSVAIAQDGLELSGPLSMDNGIQEIESIAPENEPFLQLSSNLYIAASLPQGAAPLQTTLQVTGIEGTAFLFWVLDWNGDGETDTTGQGLPHVQVTYLLPGNYFPVFYFYNDRNEVIAQAKGSIIVTGQSSSAQMQDISTYQAPVQILGQDGFQFPKSEKDNGIEEIGSQSQALTASPGGWGIIRGTPNSGKSRPVNNLSGDPDSWSPPREEFTESLRPQLYASTERGFAPLTVSFDARGTFSRYGVMRYSYDVAWGPHEAEDDGYYLDSGTNPLWTHIFDEYGMYLVILDVEDNSGKTARITKVIFVL